MSLTPATLVDQLVESPEPTETGGDRRNLERVRSLQWLKDHGLPTSRDEAWKYTPLKDLMGRSLDRAATPDDADQGGFDLSAVPRLDDEILVVLVDGIFRSDLSTDTSGMAIVVASLESPDIESFGLPETIVDPTEQRRIDGFQMLNRTLGPSGVVITVEHNQKIERPVHVVHVSSGSTEALLVQPRVDIHVAPDAQLTVVETFEGQSTAAFVNAFTSVVIEDRGELRHYKTQTQALGSVHLSSIAVRQETGSVLKASAFMFGSSISRNSIDVLVAGDRTVTELHGLYLPNGSQRMDNVVTVEHAGRHGASNQLYKGVIDDRSRGSFSGHIIVDHGTIGTDAHQHNRTLLLDPVAQSDSRPWLEIFADDVACTHGSAIGQLDEDAMFYLRSRGIPFEDARAILVGGFINEVIDKVDVEQVRDLVTALVGEKVRSRYTAELGGEH